VNILVAGVSVRAFVESAVGSGLDHRVVAVDYFGDLDLQRLCETRSVKRDLGLPYDARHLLEASRGVAFDALAYTANLENYPAIVEALRRGRRVLGNPPETLASVRDPRRLFGFLKRSGIAAPRLILSGQVEEGPVTWWLRKPIRGGGGRGIALHPPGAPLEPGYVVQEYLDGLPCSAIFAADGERSRLLGISEQLVGEKAFGATGFRYCGNILGPVGHRARWHGLIRRVARIVDAIAREFRLVGVGGIDFILSGDLPLPIEVNPRYTASMELVERAHGVNIFRVHLDACEGRLPAFDLEAQPEHRVVGKAILYATRNLVFRDPQRWCAQGARDLPWDGERIGTGRPICTVFAQGRTRGECWDGLVNAADCVYRALGTVAPGSGAW
jgi:hypothetical protein